MRKRLLSLSTLRCLGLPQDEQEAGPCAIPLRDKKRLNSHQNTARCTPPPLVVAAVGGSWPDGPAYDTSAGTEVVKVFECAALQDVYALARQGPLDLLIVPPGTRPAELRLFQERFPPTFGVLVRPLDDDPDGLAAAATLRADGYALAQEPLTRLLSEMLRGSCPMPVLMRRWLLEHQQVAARGACPLSTREMDVLRLVAHGLSNREIGRVLSLTDSLVRENVRRILLKAGAKNRTEAATYALRLGYMQ